MSEVYIHYSNEEFMVGAYAFSTLDKAKQFAYRSLSHDIVSVAWIQDGVDLWVGNVHTKQRTSLNPYGQRFTVWIRRYKIDKKDYPADHPAQRSDER